MDIPSGQERAAAFRETIVGEVFYALGLSRSGVARRLFGPLFRSPAGRIGRIAALADEAAATSGITGAARRILPEFGLGVSARGADTIPADGPLLFVSNHPGGLDSVAILSSIPRRDVSVVISDGPFTRAFDAAGRYFIFAPRDAAGRMGTLRACVGRLRNGEAVLIFAHGDVEPDPEMSPGASESIGEWSRSVEIMLRRVPEARLVAAIAGGVLMPRFVRSPLVRVRRSAPGRQKLAEVLQFIAQAVRPRSVRLDVHLSFAGPVVGRELAGGEIMPAVAAIARRLLADHMGAPAEPPVGPARPPYRNA